MAQVEQHETQPHNAGEAFWEDRPEGRVVMVYGDGQRIVYTADEAQRLARLVAVLAEPQAVSR